MSNQNYRSEPIFLLSGGCKSAGAGRLLFLLFYTQSAVQFIVHIDDHTRTQ